MDHTAPDLPPPISVSTPTVSTHIAHFSVLGPALTKTASADTNYRCWFRQAHRFTSTRVGQHLFVAPWSWFCTHVSSEAALIYKICLNLLLSSTLLHHQSASVSIFMSSAEGLVGETENQSLVQDSSLTLSILPLSCRCCLN